MLLDSLAKGGYWGLIGGVVGYFVDGWKGALIGSGIGLAGTFLVQGADGFGDLKPAPSGQPFANTGIVPTPQPGESASGPLADVDEDFAGGVAYGGYEKLPSGDSPPFQLDYFAVDDGGFA